MAELPRYLQQVIPTGGRRADTTDFGGDRGYGAVGQALGVVEQAAIRAVDANDQKNLTSAVAGAGIELSTLKADIAQNSDYSTHLDQYDAGIEEIDKRMEESLAPRVYKNFKASMQVAVESNRITINTNAIKGIRNEADAQLSRDLVTFANNASRAETEIERLDWQKKAFDAITAAEDTLVLTPQQAVKAQHEFTDTSLSTDLRENIRTDPEDALKELLKGANGRYGGFTEERIQKGIDTAVSAWSADLRRQNVQANNAERAATKREKELNDETAKTGYEVMGQGDPRALSAWADENRDRLRPADYGRFMEAADGRGDGSDNRDVVSDLIIRASAGEDVSPEAQEAFNNYDSSLDTMQEIIEIVAQGGVLPRHFDQSKAYINTAMGSDSQLVKAGGPARLANAVQEWHEWVRKNPNATPSETTYESAGIVIRNSILNANDLAITARPMRYAVGERMNPDLDASSAATLEAYQNGELTEEEFEEQSLRIDIWEEIANKRAQAEAARNLQKGSK